jgi:hypothetical protein
LTSGTDESPRVLGADALAVVDSAAGMDASCLPTTRANTTAPAAPSAIEI